jgi:hypothetical protein
MSAGALLYDLLVAVAILLAGLGVGSLAVIPLRLGEGGFFGLWLRWALGLGLLSMLTLLLGSLALLRPVVAVPLVIGFALVGCVALVRGVVAAAQAGALRPRGLGASYDALFAAAFVLAAVGSLIWILCVHTLLPPTDWDAISYHLALPKIYVEAGRLTYVNFMLAANWPLNMELLFALALLMGSDIATHLTMLGFTALAAAGLLIAARRSFNDDRVGVIAAALFLTIPLVKRLGGLALIDVAMGLYVLAAGLCFARWSAERRGAWLLLSGAFCGLAAGSKLMGGGFAILYGLLFLWGEGSRWLATRRDARPQEQIKTLLRHALVFGLAGLVLVGPWYLRSALNTGNPVWPFAYHLFGGRDWDDLGDEYNMQLMTSTWAKEQLPRNPIGLVQSFGVMLTRPESLGDYRGGLGQLILVGAAAALLLWVRAPAIVRQSLVVAIGFWALWFFLVSHQVRFLLPLAPLLALISAWAFVQLLVRRRAPTIRMGAMVMLLFFISAEWPWTYGPERALFESRLPYLRGELTREAYIDSRVDVMPLFRFANAELPQDARVLLLPYETRGYYLERGYIWAHPASQRVIRFEQLTSAEELLTTLRGLGVTHLIEHTAWMFDGLRYWQHDRALMLELEARCATSLFQNERGAVLVLNETCAPVAGGGL